MGSTAKPTDRIERVNISIPASMRIELRAIADAHDRKFSAEVRRAIKMYLSDNEEEAA